MITGDQIIGTKYHGVIVKFSNMEFWNKRNFLSTGDITHLLYFSPKLATWPNIGLFQSTKDCKNKKEKKTK